MKVLDIELVNQLRAANNRPKLSLPSGSQSLRSTWNEQAHTKVNGGALAHDILTDLDGDDETQESIAWNESDPSQQETLSKAKKSEGLNCFDSDPIAILIGDQSLEFLGRYDPVWQKLSDFGPNEAVVWIMKYGISNPDSRRTAMNWLGRLMEQCARNTFFELRRRETNRQRQADINGMPAPDATAHTQHMLDVLQQITGRRFTDESSEAQNSKTIREAQVTGDHKDFGEYRRQGNRNDGGTSREIAKALAELMGDDAAASIDVTEGEDLVEDTASVIEQASSRTLRDTLKDIHQYLDGLHAVLFQMQYRTTRLDGISVYSVKNEATGKYDRYTDCDEAEAKFMQEQEQYRERRAIQEGRALQQASRDLIANIRRKQ